MEFSVLSSQTHLGGSERNSHRLPKVIYNTGIGEGTIVGENAKGHCEMWKKWKLKVVLPDCVSVFTVS